MQHLALFIDEYDPTRFQNLLNRLNEDASILRQQQVGSIRRHYSMVRHVQIYQWQRHQEEAPLDEEPFHQAHWIPPHLRTREDKQVFYTSLARGIPQLENLSLRNCSREDLEICAESMEFPEDGSSSTKPFAQLQGFFVVLAEGQSMEQRFLRSLSQLPSLTSATFSVDALNDDCNFSVLLQSTSLKSLELAQEHVMIRSWRNDTVSHKTVNVPQQIAPLCRSLKDTNRTLRNLDIEHEVCLEGLRLIIDMLRTNESLRNLTVSFEIPNSDNDTSTEHGVVAALCDALRVNQTLWHFQNRMADRFRAGDKTHSTILSLLEASNFTLRVLDICSEEGEDDTSVRQFAAQKMMYLKLNFWGRQRTLKDTGKSEWISLMDSVRDDLDCLYYVVSTNPSIVATNQELIAMENDSSVVRTEKTIAPSETSQGDLNSRPTKRKKLN